jgi:hypothetical protein
MKSYMDKLRELSAHKLRAMIDRQEKFLVIEQQELVMLKIALEEKETNEG